MLPKSAASVFLAALVALTGCSGASSGAISPSRSGAAAASGSFMPVTMAAAASYTCPSGAMTSAGPLNCAALPLGDRKYSTKTPAAGYIYSCTAPTGSTVIASAPWIDATTKTWNALAKDVVEGTVSWKGTFAAKVSGTKLEVTGNAEPVSPETTGTFPIAKTDPAWQYDKNPNHIAAHTISWGLSASPAVAKSPTCLRAGAIGVALDGAEIYDGFDAAGYDAAAREEQDACHGHPDGSDTYHYHAWIFACVPDAGSPTQNSSLLGYALDGFGIYGPWQNGQILTSADLDECHGTTSPVMWNGQLVTMYHYVATYDFPYTLGCYRGTPLKVAP